MRSMGEGFTPATSRAYAVSGTPPPPSAVSLPLRGRMKKATPKNANDLSYAPHIAY